MVIKTKEEDDNQFINLMNAAKKLAKTDTSEIVEDLRKNRVFNLKMEDVLQKIKSELRTDSNDRDIRLSQTILTSLFNTMRYSKI